MYETIFDVHRCLRQFGEESRASGANGESQRAAQGPEEAADGAVRGVSP